MEFRLTYDGPLKAAAGIHEKHDIRIAFHEQFKIFWNQLPLKDRHELISDPPEKNKLSIITGFDGYKFAPIVCEKLHLICKLDIIFLRPEAPGSVITQGGDIDNRLKTLFDSLRMPKSRSELPPKITNSDLDNPFFCLLEDDNLITKVSVTTDRLLRDKAGQNDVFLVIHIQTKAIRGIWANLGL